MTRGRGYPHPLEVRTQAVAAVRAGMPMIEVARQYGISKGTLGNWLAADDGGTDRTDQREDKLEQIENLLLDLIAEHTSTLRAELQAAARPEWLEKQSAADLAQLVVAQRDTLIRLLAGFRPADPDDGSAAVVDAAALPEPTR